MVTTQNQVKLTEREKIIIKRAYQIGFQRGYKKAEDDHDKEMAEFMGTLGS